MLSNPEPSRRSFLGKLAFTAAGVLVPAPFVIGQSLRNPAFVARLGSSVTTAQIRTNLISFWRMEEDNATRNDSFGTNHLSQSETINRRTGKTNYAGDFVAANSRYLYIDSNAGIKAGDVDFTISAWVNMDLTASTQYIASKATTGQYEYSLYWSSSLSKFRFGVYPDGSTIAAVSTSLSPSSGTWYCVIGWHDSVNNLIGIQCGSTSLETAQTIAHSTGTYASGTGMLSLGASNVAGYFDGAIDNVAFWKRCLTQAERDYVFTNPQLV